LKSVNFRLDHIFAEVTQIQIRDFDRASISTACGMKTELHMFDSQYFLKFQENVEKEL
jgi:hypothetical protein